MQEKQGRSIWIVGADTDLGAQVAKVLAPSHTLALSGYDADAIRAVSHACQRLSNVPESSKDYVLTGTGEVVDFEAIAQAVMADVSKIDTVIFLPPSLDKPAPLLETSSQQLQGCLQSYVSAAHNLALALEKPFLTQAFGQLTVVSGIAGWIAGPQTTAEAFAHNALQHFTACRYTAWQTLGLRVQLGNPGYIHHKSMAANTMDYPFLMDAETAAQQIVNNLSSTNFVVNFPKVLAFAVKLRNLIPLTFPRHLQKLMKRLCRKS